MGSQIDKLLEKYWNGETEPRGRESDQNPLQIQSRHLT